MKTSLLLLLALFCDANAPAPPVRVTLSPLTKAAYEQAKKLASTTSEIGLSKRVTFPVKKQQGRLVIPTAAGNKVFKDKIFPKTLGTEDITYNYLGFSSKLQQHFIEVSYYESSELLLVEASGNMVKMIGPPTYAPNQQRIASAQRGVVYAMMPNGLQVFEKRAEKTMLVWELTPKAWEPAEIFWTTDSTLCVRQECCSSEGEYYTPKRFTYAKLLVK